MFCKTIFWCLSREKWTVLQYNLLVFVARKTNCFVKQFFGVCRGEKELFYIWLINMFQRESKSQHRNMVIFRIEPLGTTVKQLSRGVHQQPTKTHKNIHIIDVLCISDHGDLSDHRFGISDHQITIWSYNKIVNKIYYKIKWWSGDLRSEIGDLADHRARQHPIKHMF